MIIGEDILQLNYELTRDRNYFNSYRFRIAAKNQLEHDIQTLLKKYTVEETADILNVSINKVKAYVARAETVDKQVRDFHMTGQIDDNEESSGYYAVFK